ncbi:MAG: metal-dependent transcriptional regulator [Candidatus Eisenbacteria bacterium]|nr:metal-dependent transcriptional regulator [Candidatus Eisenbacteria bacterium]
MARARPLTRSEQDYLKALFSLGGLEQSVTVSALATRLAVSAPSVTNMLSRLAASGLVRHAPRAGARLTASGAKQALLILRRHRILETFLVRVLGLDWSEVHEDAEVLEHAVSDRVLDALDRLIEHPREDPHGHPIPDPRGRLARRSLSPLAALPSGASGTVREIRDRDRGRMARWKQAGLVPGARVRMRAVQPIDDVFELDVNGHTMVTGSEGLDGVLVERSRERSHGRRA